MDGSSVFGIRCTTNQIRHGYCVTMYSEASPRSSDAGLAFDLLVRTAELPAAIETVRRQPEVRFVVDHLAKPPIQTGDADAWARGLAALADSPNVTCKLSGLVTEADWTAWRSAGLSEYHRRAIEWFGAERCMFGSDWPVCLLAAEYGDVLALLVEALCRPSVSANARRFSAVPLYGRTGCRATPS